MNVNWESKVKKIIILILAISITLTAQGNISQVKKITVPSVRTYYSNTKTRTTNNCNWYKNELNKLKREKNEISRKYNRILQENHRLRENLSWYKKNYQNTLNIQKKYSKQTRAEYTRKNLERHNAKRDLKNQMNVDRKNSNNQFDTANRKPPMKNFTGTLSSRTFNKVTTRKWVNGKIVEEDIEYK